MVNSLFKKSSVLSPQEEVELFREIEKNLVLILSEMMKTKIFWDEVRRIMDGFLNLEIPEGVFFDIELECYGDFRRSFEVRKKIYGNIFDGLTKLANICRIFDKVRNLAFADRVLALASKLIRELGITFDFIDHMKKIVERDKEVGRKLREYRKVISDCTMRIISSNHNLIVSILSNYAMPNVPVEELFQDGNIALCKAIEKFDWRKGYKFSTYATWWVKQYILKSLNDNLRDIKVPSHIYECINKVNRTIRRFLQEYGREPTPFEIQKITSIPEEKLYTVLELLKSPCYIEDNPDLEKDFSYDPENLSNSIMEVLESEMRRILSSREKRILEARLGLNGASTLESLSRKFNLTKERVRQIERAAIRKLKKSHILRSLL